MIIGDRLRALREEKNFSQGDIEKRTGLLRRLLGKAAEDDRKLVMHMAQKMVRRRS